MGFKIPDEAYVYAANRIEAGVRRLGKRAVQWWPGLCLGLPVDPTRTCMFKEGQSGFCPCRGVVPGNMSSGDVPGLDTNTVLQVCFCLWCVINLTTFSI